jgi:ATP phosphoribosyltransferase
MSIDMSTEGNILRIGIPKGSLQEFTFRLFRKAGYVISVQGSSLFPTVDDPELQVTLLRPQEIPRYVQQGILDVGLAGYDNVVESEVDVVEIAELGAGGRASALPFRWVLAVPEDSPIREVRDLEGKRIATEMVNLTNRYLEKNGVRASVEFSWGATEVKVPHLADAIVEGTETGSSLRAHGLRIVDELLRSTTRWIANHEAHAAPWKREKMESIAMLLKGALASEGMVGLKMNAPRASLDGILALLPAMKRPTISSLADTEWVALETILPERQVRDLIPQLKRAGAEGLVEYPLNKVIP